VPHERERHTSAMTVEASVVLGSGGEALRPEPLPGGRVPALPAESIGEAIVGLEAVPGFREFILDILHERFWDRDDDFAESRRIFLAKVGERKRLKIRMAPLEEAESDAEDEKREWSLTLYAGNSRLATRPMMSFAAMADFHAACWLFHRHGVRTREIWRTLETVMPGFQEWADSPGDEDQD